MYRKTYALINCDILKQNIKNIKENYKYKYYIGVVKANAYGHGDYIVNSLIEGGINYLAASSLEECLNIRKRNEEIPILCLEPIEHEYLNICEKYNITVTIPDYEYFKDLNPNLNLKAHIKIDSGMNRLGFKSKNEVKEVYDKLKDSNIEIEGIYTHIGVSGIWDEYYDKAVKAFEEITSLIDLNQIKIIHISRSLTLVTHKMPKYVTALRLGIIMYGFAQKLNKPKGLRLIKRNLFLKKHNIKDITYENNLNLKRAFSLHTTVMSIKDVKKGEYVGYGAKYIAQEDIKIAILPIGFADGLNKSYENQNVIINNKKYKIIGEIGMDMIAVKIDDSVKLKDHVIIFTDAKEKANELGISAYQLFTSITNRVPRVYIENGNNKEIKY